MAGPLVLLVLAAIIGLGGFYNIAASDKHWPPVTWLIELGVTRAVNTHSLGVEAPPDLASPDRQILGARHFELQCASCHGSPVAPPAELSRHMLPVPPDLADTVGRWSDAELFWIVQHGLKFTAMPAWSTQARQDEVWSVVAFLRIFAELDPARYRALAGEAVPAAATLATVPESCGRCHGGEGGAPVSRLAPVLHGQTEAYLIRSLQEYRAGRRASGIMQPETAALSDADIVRLAGFYAALDPVGAAAQSPGDPLGETIATLGLPAQNVPACLACHAGTTDYPLLAGQPAPYIEAQLALWRRGVRGTTAHGAIMAAIGARLSPEQAAAVARYFESAGARP
jgi:cytochrome c553